MENWFCIWEIWQIREMGLISPSAHPHKQNQQKITPTIATENIFCSYFVCTNRKTAIFVGIITNTNKNQ
jgi:hypothetical protein